ncbi:MAG: InlB B-repeat-containing protein [Blautia sp.]|nr:InlB B-repeat-containing protein [Blautia sp.]
MQNQNHGAYGIRMKRILTIVLFFSVGILFLTSEKVSAAVKYTMVFTDKTGTSTNTEFSRLNQKVAAGAIVTLPELPERNGYAPVGWSITANDATTVYAPGKTFTAKKSMVFYAIYKPYCKLVFLNAEGKTNIQYQSLKKTVMQGKKITLPSIPARSGYVNLGWSLKAGATSADFKQGQVVKVSRNVKLYAVQAKGIKVTFCDANGKTVKTAVVRKGGYLTMPQIADGSNYTSMGWSLKKGLTVPTSKKYLIPGQKVLIKEACTFYLVTFYPDNERQLAFDDMYKPSSDINKVIFIGDSRTNRLAITLNAQFGDVTDFSKRFAFISQEGQGLGWLKDDGLDLLELYLENGYAGKKGRPTAVIVALGGNDLRSGYKDAAAELYIQYMRNLSRFLKKYNCYLYFMSVNPANSVMSKNVGITPIKEASIPVFNAKMKAASSGYYGYIDTFSWLQKKGYAFNSFSSGKLDRGVDDGLHYSSNTYKKIFNYAIYSVNCNPNPYI